MVVEAFDPNYDVELERMRMDDYFWIQKEKSLKSKKKAPLVSIMWEEYQTKGYFLVWEKI